jgi:prevent-host-death family protein
MVGVPTTPVPRQLDARPNHDHIYVTMKPTRQMGAGEFKARCLSVLDEVASTKREVVITKRGRPVARVVPLEPTTEGPLEGLIVEQGDLVSPIDVKWDAAK